MVSRADFERREGGREREEGTISFFFFLFLSKKQSNQQREINYKIEIRSPRNERFGNSSLPIDSFYVQT